METDETPEPPPAPSHRWRSTVVGAAVGGLLAAAVAVPGTWALTRQHDDTAPTAVGGQLQPGTTQPDQPDQPGGSVPGYTDPGDTDQDGDAGGWSSTRQEWTDATDAESQGVVLIDTTLTDGEAAGTGLVVDSSGLVLTNYHVVEGSTSITVTLATDGTTYDATVVGHDQQADVALLRLDGASDLTTVTLDDDGDPAVSDTVTAVGNAQGQGYLSASSGAVVALGQPIDTESSGPVEGEHLTGLIETDAYVVGGYSGGALLDDQGEVVGLTTAAASGRVAESYAIPIDDAMSVVDQIEAGHETSEVQIGPSAYLGVGIRDASDGAGVVQVENGSAADGAGIEAGDVITAVAGHRVTSVDALRSALAAYQPGDQVAVRWRDSSGRTQRATVTLGSSPTA